MFAQIGGEVKRDNVRELRKAADPARTRAEGLATANISNIGSVWSRMKVGVTSRAVYLAPRARPHGGSARPNLAGLLLHKSMYPAVKETEPEIREHIEDWLENVVSKF